MILIALGIELRSRHRLAHFADLTARERRQLEAAKPRSVYAEPLPGDARRELDVILGAARVPSSVKLQPQDLARPEGLSSAQQAALDGLSPVMPQVSRALHMNHRSGLREAFSYKTAFAIHAALARAGERRLPTEPAAGTRQILDALVFGAELGHNGSVFPALVGASLLEASCAQIERLWNQLDPELRHAALAQTSLPPPQAWLMGEKLLHFSTLLELSQANFGFEDGPTLLAPPSRRLEITKALFAAETFFEQANRALSLQPPSSERCEQAYLSLQREVQLGSLTPTNVCSQVQKFTRAQQALERLRTRAGSIR
ncbi:MAG TPA: hypothetical protein VFQ61_27815 [Polyangiaceae bacterium]|nr:hypothetical protein [Polyangiaceae bacterium]